MPADEVAVAASVAAALAKIADGKLASALRLHLIEPRRCLLEWDYGHPHDEFPEPRYPGFVVAEFVESGTGIAYSEYGFGPASPWGLIWVERPGYGMDSGWYASLEGAFRESMAWDEAPPPGYQFE